MNLKGQLSKLGPDGLNPLRSRIRNELAARDARTKSCYCACHSPVASNAWCEHCEGSLRVLQASYERRLSDFREHVTLASVALRAARDALTMAPSSKMRTTALGVVNDTLEYFVANSPDEGYIVPGEGLDD